MMAWGQEGKTHLAERAGDFHKLFHVPLVFLVEKCLRGCSLLRACISAFPVLHRQEKVKTFSSFVIVKNEKYY